MAEAAQASEIRLINGRYQAIDTYDHGWRWFYIIIFYIIDTITPL